MRLVPFFTLALFGCAPTTTDEGSIGDGDEEDVLDPAEDEDGDGINNADEEEMGLDPYVSDSDEDGFSDGAEIEAGTNPLWVWSHTFEEGNYLVGNCPVLPDEANAGPTGDGYSGISYQEGDVMKNIVVGGHDAFGQEVTLYSFCGNFVLVTLSAEWCGPCNSMASQMADEQVSIQKKVPNFTFFEYLYQDNSGKTSKERVLANWSEQYSLDGIPVVAPEDQEASADEINALVQGGGIPSTTLIAPDMTVIWSSIQHPDEYYLTGARSIKDAIADYQDAAAAE